MEGSVKEDEPKASTSRWQLAKREVLVSNRWHEYRRDQGRTDFGSDYEYFYVYKRFGSVCVVPITDDGKIVFVRQYRYLSNEDSLELPGGGCEVSRDPQQAAALELAEESGYAAKEWQRVGDVLVASGHCTDRMVIFIATGCQPRSGQQLEETEAGMSVELYTPAQAYQLIDDGKISDSLTVAALAIARRHLLKP